MRTRLRRKFKLLFVALGLLLALPAAVWADATLDTSADLSTSVATPTNVGIGDNTSKIKVWAFQGNVPSGKNGEVNVGTKYNMSTTGTITPDTTSTQKVDFSNINYSQCPSSGTIPQGCPGNPFEVTATLNVASGTPNGKTGTLTVYHAPLTDSGLIADSVPATGQVKVLIPDSTPPVITPNVSGTLGSNGWYKSDVSLTWSVTDPESTVTKIGCVDQNITADQAATDYSCSATSAGGSAGPVTVSIKRDATPPTAIQFEGGPDAGGSYPFGSVPAAPTCDANFAISGKADCVVTDYSTAVSAPGTHMMTATATDLAGNQATATRSYTVTKADQAALTVDSPNSGTYGQKLTMTASGGSTDGAITFSVVPGSSACAIVASGPDQGKLEITDGMGTCKITATRAGNANYNDVTSAQHTVAVNKRAVTVTADAKSKVYGEDDPELTYQITSGSLVNNDSFDGALSRAPGNNVGTYAIQQGTLALPTSKYTLAYVGADLTIDPRPITVTPDSGQSKPYGEADPELTYTLTSPVGPPALVGSDQLNGALSRAPGNIVGSYEINLGSLEASSNYTLSLSSTPVDFEITARPITVTAVTDTKTYNGTTSSDENPIVTGGIVDGDTANFSQAFADKNVGTGKKLTPSGSVSDNNNGDNYAITYVDDDTGVIEPASLEVNADNQTKVYGDADPSPLTWSYSGFVDGENAGNVTINGDANCSISAPSNVGAHADAITCAPGTLSTQNYTFATGTKGTLTITSRPITVTADAKSKTYGDADPALTYQITSGNLVGSDAFTGALTRAPGNNVGTYAIQQGTLSLSSNYNLTYVGTNLTINKRPITVTADAKSKLFGDPDPAPLTYQVTSQLNPALVGTDQLTGSLTRVAGEAVGTYTIQQGTLTAGSNYTITYVGANLTIGAWTPSGFYSPVGLPNSYYQAPGGPLPPAPTSANDATLNTAKGGSTVPLKFNIFAGSVEKTSTSDVKGFSATKLSGCASGADVDEIDFITTGSTSLRYDTTAKQFIQNWQTPKVNSDTCYRTTVTFQDGTSIHAFFRLRK